MEMAKDKCDDFFEMALAKKALTDLISEEQYTKEVGRISKLGTPSKLQMIYTQT
jgi:hypothetical protein